MTIQNGQAPFTLTCLVCGKSWRPEPAKSGPNKNKHTDASLQRSSEQHQCEGAPNET